MPSVPAIEQYVRRVFNQAGRLWRLSKLELDILDPTSWGWKLFLVSKFFYIPLWQDCISPDVHCLLKTYFCVKGSCDNQSYKKSEMSCRKF